jgi:hypothetical protein
MKQFPPQLREGMNPELVCNVAPYIHQTSKIEGRYWSGVCKVSARQQKTRTPLARPTPPKSLERDFMRYANDKDLARRALDSE